MKKSFTTLFILLLMIIPTCVTASSLQEQFKEFRPEMVRYVGNFFIAPALSTSVFKEFMNNTQENESTIAGNLTEYIATDEISMDKKLKQIEDVYDTSSGGTLIQLFGSIGAVEPIKALIGTANIKKRDDNGENLMDIISIAPMLNNSLCYGKENTKNGKIISREMLKHYTYNDENSYLYLRQLLKDNGLIYDNKKAKQVWKDECSAAHKNITKKIMASDDVLQTVITLTQTTSE